jgi:alkanesulfonate monooxygenase SsuD/methylene tetrahydromethanopterin reductase-like flavin-dependent oxidoreductase (luciferase family)
VHATGVSFGALLLPSAGWPSLAQRAREVEAAGFDALWLDDHISHPVLPEAPWLDCFTALAGLAGVTRRITLGPLVANIVLRHPAVLARQALTVAERDTNLKVDDAVVDEILTRLPGAR